MPEPSRRELRAFAWTVGAAFVVLALALAWRGRTVACVASGALGAALLLAGALVPSRLGPVHRAWMGLATAMSRVTTPVFMAIVYFVVLTPIALVRRALGKNALARRRADSHWIARPPEERRSDLRRQF